MLQRTEERLLIVLFFLFPFFLEYLRGRGWNRGEGALRMQQLLRKHWPRIKRWKFRPREKRRLCEAPYLFWIYAAPPSPPRLPPLSPLLTSTRTSFVFFPPPWPILRLFRGYTFLYFSPRFAQRCKCLLILRFLKLLCAPLPRGRCSLVCYYGVYCL